MSGLEVKVQGNHKGARKLAKDLALLCRREETPWNFDADEIENAFEETNYLLELYRGTERIGFLLLLLMEGAAAKIDIVCVSKKETGRGLSKLLIDKAKELAKEAGKTEIELEPINDKVKNIYTAQGFVKKGDGMMSASLTGGSRLHKQARRTHRNRRNLKHRKLRNLSTRRR